MVFFYKKCNATTTPSNTISKMLVNHGLSNVHTIPNTVDPKLFNIKTNGTKLRQSLKIKDTDKVILYVGRLSKEKKIEVLLKSAKHLKKDKDKKFVIAGSGPAELYYKAMAKRLHLDNVQFLGAIKRENLPEVYASSDVFCIPSTFETQGIVALEAMAMGKPVVCADYLALKELVSNGKNGEKFKPGDYIECSKKIEKALNNTDAYINGAVKTAKDFYPKTVTDKLLDVYYSVLNSR